MRLMVLRHEDILRERGEAARINSFDGGLLDPFRMASAIGASLHRNRRESIFSIIRGGFYGAPQEAPSGTS